jgi:hypothetical protein
MSLQLRAVYVSQVSFGWTVYKYIMRDTVLRSKKRLPQQAKLLTSPNWGAWKRLNQKSTNKTLASVRVRPFG